MLIQYIIWGHDPLCMTVGWQPTMVKYCMMHTLYLGLCHWVNAGALLTLIHHNFFGSSTARKTLNPPQTWIDYFLQKVGIQGTQTMTEIMHLLNRRFLDWCRLHIINPGQTYIGTAHLHQEDWAELRLKAYASRALTAFMCAYKLCRDNMEMLTWISIWSQLLSNCPRGCSMWKFILWI